MLRDKIKKYYLDQENNCAESMLMAANDEYELGMGEAEKSLIKGFGGGMGCDSTCGALAASVAVIGKMCCTGKTKDEAHDIIGGFVSEFKRKIGSTLCAEIKPKFRKEGTRCYDMLLVAADLLDKYVKRSEGKSEISAEEIKRVKGLGCLQDRRYTDIFNIRVITRNGKLTSDEQEAVAEAARIYGSGEVTMTARLTLEVQGVPYDRLEDCISFLNNAGLATGGTGSKVRPVVSCKGTTCQYGLYDTSALALAIHDKFYTGYHDIMLPHKFKIAVGGCPNNCAKPDLNDLGVIGQRVPHLDTEKCKGCSKCGIETQCPMKAAKVVDGKLTIDANICNNCGRCYGKCRFGAVDFSDGFKICIGGRWGKKTAIGRPLERVIYSEGEVMDIIERAILLFRDEGISGERFSDTIARLGFKYVQEKLLDGDINKEKILKKKVKGGASC